MVCNQCKKNKRVDEFYTRRTAHGYKPRLHCKACHIATIRKNQAEDDSSSKMYYWRNGEARRAYQRAYYWRKKGVQRDLHDVSNR
jgi:hypothetical protein